MGQGTHVCLLTPPGRGAVAVIGVQGQGAIAVVANFFRPISGRKLDDLPMKRIVYGHWQVSKNHSSAGEDLIVCKRSDTALEIHCHGGSQSSARIVGDLASAGCQEMDAATWLLSEYSCSIQAAAHQALASATTSLTASILLDQYHGALRREIESMVADLEASRIDAARSRLNKLLDFAKFGLHLTKPWQVVIAGQPNVGKSSLINAIVGYERAIVFDQPGTTRDVVTATTAVDGWPIELSDTAGMHASDNAIEMAGIQLARQRLAAADLIVWVLDASEIPTIDEFGCGPLVQQQAEQAGVAISLDSTLIVVNKTDLASIDIARDEEFVATSAVTGDGMPTLLETMARRLVPHLPEESSAVPFTPTQVDRLRACATSDLADASAILRQLLSG